MDWSSLDLRIAGELSATGGLRKRREALEQFLAPYVTTRKTADTILFKGKRRYAKPLNTCRNENEIAWSIYALQSLYEIEAARKAGDIDKAIGAAVAFGRCDDEVLKFKLCKSGSWDALLSRMRKQIVGRSNVGKLNSGRAANLPNYAATVEEGLADGLSYTKSVERAASIHDCDEKTIRNHVPNSAPQNRGRWSKGRKNAKRLS